MAWGKLSSVTGDGSSTTLTTGTIEAGTFVQSMLYTDTFVSGKMLFNSDSGSNYARRYSGNGAGDTTNTGMDKLAFLYDLAPALINMYIVNISEEEKLVIGWTCEAGTAGAGTAPNRMELVFKWANTSAQITDYTVSKNAPSITTSTNLTVLGSDMTPSAAIPFAENAQVGSRAEITDTRKMYHSVPDITVDDAFTTDNWTDNDSTKIGVSSNAMQFNCVTDGSVDNSIRSMTTVSDTIWLLQFKLNFTSLAQAGAGDNNLFIGLTAGTQTTSMNAGADNHVYVYHQTNNSGSKNKFILNSTGGTQDIGTFAPTTGVDYYCTITRSSATTTQFIIRITSHTGAIQETLDVTNGTATTTLINGIVANRDTSLTSGSKTGTVDDWKFYSGVTTVPTVNVWKEEGT